MVEWQEHRPFVSRSLKKCYVKKCQAKRCHAKKCHAKKCYGRRLWHMRKIFIVVLTIIITIFIVIAAVVPAISRSSMPPYFLAVNDTLLPFNETTMPYISGGDILVPHSVFGEAEVWSAASDELDRVRIYRGSNRHVDFYTARGLAEDQDGNVLPWPAARKVGGRFYVPLRQVCEFFDLTLTFPEVGRDIIPQEQMYIIRIRSREGLNDRTFVGFYRESLKSAYNEYYSISTSPSPPTTSPTSPQPPTVSPGVPTYTPPSVEPPPIYSDVTVYHSFYGIADGGTDVIFELLDANAASDYRFCFFVSAADIRKDAGLIRKIAADGHAIGIWLEQGTYREYEMTSMLLYEATKVKTILVMLSEAASARTSLGLLNGYGLIIWSVSGGLVYDDTFSVDAVTEMIPKESGARMNLISSCSENTALMLSGILAYLREFEYSVAGINETTAPA